MESSFRFILVSPCSSFFNFFIFIYFLIFFLRLHVSALLTLMFQEEWRYKLLYAGFGVLCSWQILKYCYELNVTAKTELNKNVSVNDLYG